MIIIIVEVGSCWESYHHLELFSSLDEALSFVESITSVKRGDLDFFKKQYQEAQEWEKEEKVYFWWDDESKYIKVFTKKIKKPRFFQGEIAETIGKL